jgi:hypothetical protein
MNSPPLDDPDPSGADAFQALAPSTPRRCKVTPVSSGPHPQKQQVRMLWWLFFVIDWLLLWIGSAILFLSFLRRGDSFGE